MKKINIKKIFQNSNKAFLFILISTSLIWFILKLSKTYTDTIEFNYELKNLPKNKIIKKSNNEIIKVQLEATGIKFISFSLFEKTILIDFNQLEQVDDNYYLANERIKSVVQENLELPNGSFDIKTKDINISTYKLYSKKVGIQSRINIDFATGYDSVADFQFTPDSLTIYGNQTVLDTIHSVSTQQKTVHKVKESLEDRIAIDLSQLDIHDISQKEVDYKLKVAKYTEKKIKLPIDVINVPDNMKLSIFPKEIQMNIEVELQHYDDITNKDFRLICDYKKREKDDNVLTPYLDMKPKHIKNIRFNTSKVNYLIRE
ncbi:hypothetical protein SAMN05421540_102317 [Psychroflexus halocasei]|uniref:YbbR-like protein n=1 Tax=Psychroflexus halocasei TaxID=908615 RepID=A0A1H3XBY4_9FLAO|nr:hypothetical protein SAMN05421540_102317 [Psychroflexus halocasei]